MDNKNKGRLKELYQLFKNRRQNDLEGGECFIKLSFPFVDEILLPILEANLPEEARVLSAEEVKTARGTGYLEDWLDAVEEWDGTVLPATRELFPAAWLGGKALADADTFDLTDDNLYNRPYGYRVWTAEPTAEQRNATPWDGEGTVR